MWTILLVIFTSLQCYWIKSDMRRWYIVSFIGWDIAGVLILGIFTRTAEAFSQSFNTYAPLMLSASAFLAYLPFEKRALNRHTRILHTETNVGLHNIGNGYEDGADAVPLPPITAIPHNSDTDDYNPTNIRQIPTTTPFHTPGRQAELSGGAAGRRLDPCYITVANGCNSLKQESLCNGAEKLSELLTYDGPRQLHKSRSF